MKIFYVVMVAIAVQIIVALFYPASDTINTILFSLVLILYAIDMAVEELKK